MEYGTKVKLRLNILSEMKDQYFDNSFWGFDFDDGYVSFCYNDEDLEYDKEKVYENEKEFYWEMDWLERCGENIIYEKV